MYVRRWDIPPELVSGFFSFWNKNENLKNQGFSVKKEDSGWVLREWKRFKSDFSNIGKYETSDKYKIPDKTSFEILPIKDPSGLRDWQPKVVEKLCAVIRKYGSAIDGSDMGTGKTFCAVAVARELGLKIGIVCPKAVITSWERAIKDHFKMKPEFIINYEGLRTGKYKNIGTWEYPKKNSNIKNFIWNVPDPKNTLIIFDEAHKIKSWNSQVGEISVEAYKAGYKILCLSATSAVKPTELRVIGKILKLHEGKLKEFEKFLEYYGCEKGRYGWNCSPHPDALKRLHFEMFVERGTRIKKEEIPSFPDCDLTAEAFSLDDKSTSEFNDIYFQMEKELSELEEIQKKERRRGSNHLVSELRSRQKMELLKVPIFLELVEDALEAGMSVALFLNFTETINALSKLLDTNCIISGENVNDRQKNIDDFQSDKSRVILVNIKAGGAGVSLHDLNGNHPRLALISPPLSAVDLKQSTGRIWRSGAKTKAIQKIIFVANSPEEKVCNSLKNKLENMDMINDGDLVSKRIFNE